MNLDTNSSAAAIDTRNIPDSVHKAIDSGVGKAHKAVDAIASATQTVSNKASEACDRASDFVKARPFTSVLIALGVGALAARLICGRR